METKQNEVVITTNDVSKLLGLYTKGRVCRVWFEEFRDADTGDTVSIERKEILMEAGELLNKEALAKMSFYLQSGDIAAITATNQKRKGIEYEYNSAWPWMIRFNVGDKKENWMVRMRGGASAVMAAARDFMELRCTGYFGITQIQAMNDAIIIETQEPTEDERAAAANCGEPLPDWNYYKLELNVAFEPLPGDEVTKASYQDGVFVVKQATVEAAMMEVEKYVLAIEQKRFEKDATAGKRELKISIQKIAPIKITGVIPEEFAIAYAGMVEE